jgi:5-methyltetrahydrofolate--homocysteine methyltransferase
MLSSATKEVIIGDGLPTVLIGERINPSGKKKMAEALRTDNLDVICEEAIAQVQAGADVLDVNVNTLGVDEVTMLPRIVRVLMEKVDVPLCFDCTNPSALKAALKVYKGKPLINSVSGEEQSLAKILPLVKEYGASVIGLIQDDAGIPGDAEQRLVVARKIVERAGSVGIPPEDVIIDCLSLAVGANTKAGLVTIESIQLVKAELGQNMTMGASNISFGLPDRTLLDNAFLAIIIAAGVNCPIVDVAKVHLTALAADMVLGNDRRGRRYTESYRQRQASEST